MRTIIIVKRVVVKRVPVIILEVRIKVIGNLRKLVVGIEIIIKI